MKAKPTSYDDGKGIYKDCLEKAVEEIMASGNRLPTLNKITGKTVHFQFRGHERVWNELQGYWERNSKDYLFRARVEYRALYLGMILLLKEEQIISGQDNREELSQLEILIEQRRSQHKSFQKMILLKQEVCYMLEELDAKMISSDNFDRDVMSLINTADNEDNRILLATMIDNIIEDEMGKLKNRNRQRKHRFFERSVKKIQPVS